MEYRKARLSNYELKLIAKKQLNGHYSIFIGMFFAIMCINMVLGQPTTMLGGEVELTALYANPAKIFSHPELIAARSGANLIVTLIMTVFNVGLVKLHLDLTEDEELKFKNIIFGWQSGFWRYIGGAVLKFLITLIPIALMTGGIVLVAVGAVSTVNPVGMAGAIMYTIGTVASVIIGFALAMVNIILVDRTEMGPVEAVSESIKMMKGNKFRFFCLCLSFIGWLILGVFTFGILYLWLIPYMSQTMTLFYKEISGQIRLVDEEKEAEEKTSEPTFSRYVVDDGFVQEEVKEKGWTCEYCLSANEGNFCTNCGAKKPEE